MRLVQLKWYLRSATNAIMDSAMHVDGMTRDEAMKLMTETGFQEEREAAGKWVRAQLSSTQLTTYFVGYQEHSDMRAEAERRWGARFNLKDYHDRVLSYGTPPVRFVRELMLDEQTKVTIMATLPTIYNGIGQADKAEAAARKLIDYGKGLSDAKTGARFQAGGYLLIGQFAEKAGNYGKAAENFITAYGILPDPNISKQLNGLAAMISTLTVRPTRLAGPSRWTIRKWGVRPERRPPSSRDSTRTSSVVPTRRSFRCRCHCCCWARHCTFPCRFHPCCACLPGTTAPPWG